MSFYEKYRVVMYANVEVHDSLQCSMRVCCSCSVGCQLIKGDTKAAFWLVKPTNPSVQIRISCKGQSSFKMQNCMPTEPGKQYLSLQNPPIHGSVSCKGLSSFRIWKACQHWSRGFLFSFHLPPPKSSHPRLPEIMMAPSAA